MSKDPREEPRPNEPAAQVPESLEDGLAAGFGPASSPAGDPAPSVLEQLAVHSGVRPRIALRDEPSQAPSRILKPLGPNAAGLPTLQGKYQLQGEIARGGVGVVLKGHDVDLGRDVAMKLLHEKYLDNPDLLQRFVEEAQIGGQLQHPGIVPVYDLGLQGDRPYFTMRLVKGRTLAALLEERSDPSAGRQRLLSIFEQVCQTMAYAHARGVIHRDLKPANVMVGAFGEVQVVDWGMGKVLFSGGTADEERSQRKSTLSVIETVRSQPGSGSTHSIVGSVMGTPAYMPPEQANGDVERMDERSDVFALGAILCEVLTGVPPYSGPQDQLLTMAAKAQLDPCKDRLAQCGADEELRELCIDCLLPAPATRPRSAEVVAGQIAAYLAGVDERGRAAQIEAAEERVRAGSARRAQRLTLGLAISVLVTLILGGGGFWWVERQARTRRAAAEQRVTDALDEASALLGKARAAGLADLGLWDRAASAAGKAVELAERDDLPEDRVREVRAVLATVTGELTQIRHSAAERAREEQMHERLSRLRISPDEDLRDEEWPRREAERLNHEYGEAFAEYLGGVRIEAEGIEEAVLALRQGQSLVELAIALDHWAMVRDEMHLEDDAAFTRGTGRLREIAARADRDDPWRNGLRPLLPQVRSNRAELERLAEEAHMVTLPAVNVVLLGEALWAAGANERALAVYRRGRELHPSDFGICYRLAVLLELFDESLLTEVVDVLQVANALRPNMREVLHRQGMALAALARHEEALRRFEDLSRREPDDQHMLAHIGWALNDLGRKELALAVKRRIHEIDPETDWGHQALLDVLLAQRDPVEVLESLRSASDWIASRSHDHTSTYEEMTTTLIKGWEGKLTRRPLLEEILNGERGAGSGQEWAWAARLAYEREDHALSARTYRAAFLAYPALLTEPGQRYVAACAAALCGAGSGRDADQLDESQRAGWRAQAVAWLFAELEHQAARAEQDPALALKQLSYWRYVSDLAGIREEAAIAGLPEPERAECHDLWEALRVQLEVIRARGQTR